MDPKIVEVVATQGPWAALFLGLLWWVLKTTKEREDRYISVIDKLSDEIIPELKYIKEQLRR